MYSEQYFAGGHDHYGYVDYDRDKEPMIPAFEQYLDRIEQHQFQWQNRTGGTLLDVGAATGFFLEIAARGPWKVQGLEPCDAAACRARRKGLNVATGILSAPVEPLDVITAFDVLEHMPDPRSFVRLAARSLAFGGLLAVNTPDNGSAVAKIMGIRWHAVLPPEHLHLFNRRSLRLLLEQEGFEILETSSIGKSFTLQYIFQTLARVQGFKLWGKLAAHLPGTRLGSTAVPLNLHDNVFVLARVRSAA